MKFHILFLLPLLLCYPAIGQDLPEKFYFILENKAIVPDTSGSGSLNRYMVDDGDKMVFHFRKQTKKFDNTIAYDAGYRLDFYFQVPAGTEEFELRDEELKEAMAYSKPFCRCIPSWTFYDRGIIKGKKLNENEWKIDFQIHGASPQKENQPDTLETSGIFRK